MKSSKAQFGSVLIALVCLYGAYLLGKNSRATLITEPNVSSDLSLLTPDSQKLEQAWIDIKLDKNEDSEKAKLSGKVDNSLYASLPKKILKSDIPLLATQKDKVSAFIAQAEPEEIDFYLGQYFNDEVLINIRDKRAFSERLLHEYSEVESEEENAVYGDIVFSINSNFPEEISTNFNLNYKQKMYAHLRLNGSLENSGAIFIRWLRLIDGKVLLFERKPVNINSSENWVSFKPKNMWKEGAYLVTYYSFDSNLKVIAQNMYQVDYVGN